MKYLQLFALSISVMLASCNNSDDITTDDTVDPTNIDYTLN